MCHVCIVGVMVRGLEGPVRTVDGLSVWLQPHHSLSQMGEGDCEDPIAQSILGMETQKRLGKLFLTPVRNA